MQEFPNESRRSLRVGLGYPPELRGLAKPEQERLYQEAQMQAKKALLSRPLGRLVHYAIGLAILGSFLFGPMILAKLAYPILARFSVPYGPCVVFAFVAWFVAAVLAQRYVFDPLLIRPHLWPLLPSLCPACGYDLTANKSGVCPECGRAVDRPIDGVHSPHERSHD